MNRTADVIAAEINTIKFETKKAVLNSFIEIGRRLVEAKALVPHGEWGNWLESVNYKKSTANTLMNIFDKYSAGQINLLGDNVKSQAIGELGFTQALKLLSIKDDDEREAL